MIKAELAGKVPTIANWEDILTSDVFGLVSYLERRKIWKGLAKELGITLTVEKAENTVFEFWPKLYGNVEPDIVIYAGRYILIVECKYGTGFGKNQIVRETAAGLKLLKASTEHDKLLVLGVSTDLFEPGFFKELRKEYKGKGVKFEYLRWQQIKVCLESLVSDSDSVTMRLVEDLSQVLDRRGILSYSGFDIKGLRKVRDAKRPAHEMLNNLKSLQEDLLVSLKQHDIDSRYPGRWHDEHFNTNAYKWPTMPGFAMLDFLSTEWPSSIFWQRRFLYVKLMLAIETGKIWVGYYFRVLDNEYRGILKNRVKEIRTFVRDYPASIVVQKDVDLKRRSRLTFEKVTYGEITSEGFFDKVTFIEIFKRMDADTDVGRMARTLIDICDFVNQSELLPIVD